MNVTLQMGPEFNTTVSELGAMGKALIDACSKGLERGGQITVGSIARDYLSGQSLSRRTGMLAKHIGSWLHEPLHLIVGVPDNSPVDKYKWLLGDESKTITPKRARALTIPIGEALTAAGVPKYQSVRDAAAQLGVKLFRPKGSNVLGYARGKKGKFRPLFVLVKSVFIQGSSALSDGVLDNLDVISGEIENEIEGKI
ncbi:MAG: hypothetical protein WC877_05195 [Dehalococcoidales bacterium]|jgi:hypothetical protein|nr:hypothetical protein [Candidatus Neomarinimicrobiota bacterium]